MNSPLLFAIGPLGGPEILILLFIILLLFGAKKLPELARGLGKAKNEFQKASHEVEKEVNSVDEPPASSPPTSESKKQTAPTSTPGNN